ncbi:MAG TPA: exodeoxyribonuclease VII large subunit [Candidatus Saccharimonadales bacterium]|nr:exodeoxyribonuclease VII large subunit [Candidatus Saccharimonadales bacterium]
MKRTKIVNDVELAPSEFVALLNQTLEYAYPNVTVHGELANFRVSKNRWVYFDLKDELATVRFFGTVYQLPGPLEDGMLVRVRGVPRLHPQYGFSVTVQAIAPMGEGSIKKAAALLEAKLAAEGLFDPARKRPLPYPPKHIGLITSAESAAYRDFIKILQARWGGIAVTVIDVQVQGEPAPAQIVQAIAQCNQLATPPDVLVVTRGGGSAEDLQAFSTEQVTRAVAASRIPTVVAIGHEVDISLAELAADQRASTPSNAAELLTPDRAAMLHRAHDLKAQLAHAAEQVIRTHRTTLRLMRTSLTESAGAAVHHARLRYDAQSRLLAALDPQAALRRGYAVVRKEGRVVHHARDLAAGDALSLNMVDADLAVTVQQIQIKKEQTHAKA